MAELMKRHATETDFVAPRSVGAIMPVLLAVILNATDPDSIRITL